MGAVPVISAIKVLPTYRLSIEFTPPDSLAGIGGSITSYKVKHLPTGGGSTTTISGLSAITHGSYSYLRRVSQFDRGLSKSVIVTAVGPGGEADSAPVDVTIQRTSSWPQYLRQNIFEVLADAGLSIVFQGATRTIRMHQDQWGEPLPFRDVKSIGDSFPAIGILAGRTETSTQDSNGHHTDTIAVPIQLLDAQQDPDDGQEVINRMDNLVRATLANSGALRMDDFGVSYRVWAYSFTPMEHLDNAGKTFGSLMTVNVPVQIESNRAIPYN